MSSAGFNLEHYRTYSRLETGSVLFHRSTGTQNLSAHKPTFPVALSTQPTSGKCTGQSVQPRHQTHTHTHTADDSLHSSSEHADVFGLLFCVARCSTASLKASRQIHAVSPVSSALGDVDQLLDAARVSQGLGVLHVFAGDLVQGATYGRHGLI